VTNFVVSRLNADAVYNIPLLTPKQNIDIKDKISSNKASGYDGISVRVLKKIVPVFASPLCKLLNLSISKTEQFSQSLENSLSYTTAQRRRTK